MMVILKFSDRLSLILMLKMILKTIKWSLFNNRRNYETVFFKDRICYASHQN